MSGIPGKALMRQAVVCVELARAVDHAVIAEKQPADAVLARFYRAHREYGARDRRFLSNAIFSWFRWRGWLTTPDKERVAAAILLDGIEESPQARYMLGGSALEPLGRLAMEDKAVRLQEFLKCGSLPPELLTPAWLAGFLHVVPGSAPEQHFRRCIESFQARPPAWLRLSAASSEMALAGLKNTGIEIKCHPRLPQAVRLKGWKSLDGALGPGVEVQDISAQCVGLCCAPRPGEQWWDMCAGAGGKSLHLADLMGDRGGILATDIRPGILEQLSKRMHRNLVRSIRTKLWDDASDPMPGREFDGILVDAPCSGIGTWARNPDARWRISPEQIQEYTLTQRRLLAIAAPKLRPGGKLVYATCTLTDMENAEIIHAFLERHPAFRPAKFANPLTGTPADGSLWLWPWETNGNGMFIALMQKDV